MPSTGVRTEAKSRSRSALASEVFNSANWASASACCARVTSTLLFARVIGRLRRLDAGDALVAPGFRLLESGVRREALGAQRLLAIIVEAGALQSCFGGRKIGLRLLDRTLSAATWRPKRSMVACWVAILVRAASTAIL